MKLEYNQNKDINKRNKKKKKNVYSHYNYKIYLSNIVGY